MNIQIYPEFHILEPPHDKKKFKLKHFQAFFSLKLKSKQ